MSLRPKLLTASSFYAAAGGIVAHRAFYFGARAAKSGRARAVAMHRRGPDGIWRDTPMSVGYDGGNYEGFNYSEQLPIDSRERITFCIKHTVDGICHWDNNNGADYCLPPNDGIIMAGNISLAELDIESYDNPGYMLSPLNSHLVGKLWVRDLAYEKVVGVRYTDDGWKSWREDHAYWVRNISDAVQMWEFTIVHNSRSGDTRPTFRFALFYQDVPSGRWHWDNNFEQDYCIVAPAAGSTSHLEQDGTWRPRQLQRCRTMTTPGWHHALE